MKNSQNFSIKNNIWKERKKYIIELLLFMYYYYVIGFLKPN